MTVKKKIIAWTTVALLLLAAAFFYLKFYYVFGEGIRAEELNFVVYKGYVRKTYELRRIGKTNKKREDVKMGIIEQVTIFYSDLTKSKLRPTHSAITPGATPALSKFLAVSI